MPETCTCKESPGACEASPAAHIKAAAEFVVLLSRRYDKDASRGHLGHGVLDQASAVFRDTYSALGIDRTSREQVGVAVVMAAIGYGHMMCLPAGPLLAAAAAKLFVLAVPLVEEMADG